MDRWDRRPLEIVAAVALDGLLGDPENRFHPVAWFGRAASMLESAAYADSVARGGVVWAALVLPVAAVGAAGEGSVAAAAIGLWSTLGGRSLRTEAERIALLLEAGDLVAARAALRNLAGRDASELGGAEIARAVIESVAENSADAVIGPLVWHLLLGLKGSLAFRAVNTLDAMFGHRDATYRNFGRVSARADDLMVYLPARVGAALGIPAALWRTGLRASVEVWRRSRGHPSPNAGRMEALFAAVCRTNLGGANRYRGSLVKLPELSGGRSPSPQGIRCAVALSRQLELALAGIALAIWVRGRLAGSWGGWPGAARDDQVDRGAQRRGRSSARAGGDDLPARDGGARLGCGRSHGKSGRGYRAVSGGLGVANDVGNGGVVPGGDDEVDR